MVVLAQDPNKKHNIEHKYAELKKHVPTKRKLDYLEEKFIRKEGMQKEGGKLLNKRHQVGEQRYKELEKEFVKNPINKANKKPNKNTNKKK